MPKAVIFFFSSRRRHTRLQGDWSSTCALPISFRRLKHKTQVFFSPTGDHYRTRLTHTLEVSQIARTIAKVLRLHEELTEAIALGHDLGHTPFGHAGERVIDSQIGRAHV